MWSYRRPPRFDYPFSQRRLISFYGSFQWRYTLYLLCAVLAALIVSGGPIYYFLNQNYDIFIRLAYRISPELLRHLERERIWTDGFLIVTLISTMIFCAFWSVRMTTRIIGPLKILEDHMRQLTRGYWFIPEIQVRDKDEFSDLIGAYNYFYKTIQHQMIQDLNGLTALKLDPQHRQSIHLWKATIAEKQQQLLSDSRGVFPVGPKNAIDGGLGPVRDSHRGS